MSLARPEPLYECAADGPKEDFGDMANGESRTGRQCGVGRQREIGSTRGFRADRSAEGTESETDGSTGCRFGLKSASASWRALERRRALATAVMAVAVAAMFLTW